MEWRIHNLFLLTNCRGLLPVSITFGLCSYNLTLVPIHMENVFNFESVVSENLRKAYFTTEHDMTICKTRKESGSAKLLSPFLPLDK